MGGIGDGIVYARGVHYLITCDYSLQAEGVEIMEVEKPFNKYTHCHYCKRYIDEETVKLKRIVTSGDTYRQFDQKYLDTLRYEKTCTDCAKR